MPKKSSGVEMTARSSATGPGIASPMPDGYSPSRIGSANNQLIRLSYSAAASLSSALSLAGQVGAWFDAMPMLDAPAARSACTARPWASS